ncbi:MAG: septum formation initiator family protein [Fidelibacterota bacterium]
MGIFKKSSPREKRKKKTIRKIRRKTLLKRRLKIAFILTVIVFIITIFVRGDHGLYQLYKLEREKRAIEKRINELKTRRENYEKEIRLLESDIKYIEKLAREKYGMAKEGERVYKVVPKRRKSSPGK